MPGPALGFVLPRDGAGCPGIEGSRALGRCLPLPSCSEVHGSEPPRATEPAPGPGCSDQDRHGGWPAACLAPRHLVYHPRKLILGLSGSILGPALPRGRGEAEEQGEHGSTGLLLAPWLWVSWGRALWGHSLSWGTEEGASSGASPALDEPSQPAGCQALRRPCGAGWSNGQPETRDFGRSTTLGLPCHKPSSPCPEAGPLCRSRCEGESTPASS